MMAAVDNGDCRNHIAAGTKVTIDLNSSLRARDVVADRADDGTALVGAAACNWSNTVMGSPTCLP